MDVAPRFVTVVVEADSADVVAHTTYVPAIRFPVSDSVAVEVSTLRSVDVAP